MIRYGFWDTGSELPMLIVTSVREVAPMDVSSLANWEVYSFRSHLVSRIQHWILVYGEVD